MSPKTITVTEAISHYLLDVTVREPAVLRELREEIGLVLAQAPKRLFKINACAETDQEFVWVYRWEAEGPFELNRDEIERGGWFAPAEVTRWMADRPQEFATGFRYIWKHPALHPKL